MRPFAHLLQVGFPLGSPFPDTSKTPAAVAAKVPALRSCAARYGWPGTPVINSFADFVSWVAGHLDGPVSKGSAAEVLALNHHWAPIFVKCAGPTATVQYRLWTAQQKIFLARHRAQVQALVALAIRVMTIAERQAGTTAG